MATSLDDTFDGGSRDPSWTVLHVPLVSINVAGGLLSLTPTATGAPDIWFNDGEGPLVHKEVTGDFDVRTVLTVLTVSNWAATPTGSASGELRLRRSGATIEMYHRPDSIAGWNLIQSFNRADLRAPCDSAGPRVFS